MHTAALAWRYIAMRGDQSPLTAEAERILHSTPRAANSIPLLLLRAPRIPYAAKKSNSEELDFFICAVRHNIVCVAHATSFDRQVNIIAACGTNERGCDKSQMMWAITQRCYAYGVNDVALRANGIVAVRLYY